MKISFWTGWSVTGRTYAKKWRWRIAVGTVNSRETILPRRKKIFLLSFSFLSFRTRSPPSPYSCSWITTSAVPARFLPCFFPSCQPNGDGCISRFSPRQVFLFLVVFPPPLPVKSYRFVCASPFPTTLRRFSGGILDA